MKHTGIDTRQTTWEAHGRPYFSVYEDYLTWGRNVNSLIRIVEEARSTGDEMRFKNAVTSLFLSMPSKMRDEAEKRLSGKSRDKEPPKFEQSFEELRMGEGASPYGKPPEEEFPEVNDHFAQLERDEGDEEEEEKKDEIKNEILGK